MDKYMKVNGHLYYRCQKCSQKVVGSYIVMNDMTFHPECARELTAEEKEDILAQVVPT